MRLRVGAKNWINRVLNLVLYLNICFMLGTGLLIWFRLPPGSRGGHGLTSLGLDRHQWGDLHKYAGLAIIAATILHLLMNWTWMRKIAGGRHQWRLWLGLVIGIVLIAAFFVMPVEGEGETSAEHGAEFGADGGGGEGGGGGGRGAGRLGGDQ